MVLRLSQAPRYRRPQILDDHDICNANEAMDLSGENIPFFENVDKKWGWKNELLLLDCVRSYGLFNWKRITRILNFKGRVFDAKEVENHYKRHYCTGTLGCVWKYSLFLKREQVDFVGALPDFDPSETDKYLPEVSISNLQSIKFMPHRQEFLKYPTCEFESTMNLLEFSSDIEDFQNKLDLRCSADFPTANIVMAGQMAIVDGYRKTVFERKQLLKFMKNFKLIEQYFLNGPTIMSRLKSNEGSQDSQKVDKDYLFLIKYVQFFNSVSSFNKFFHNCVKETVMKMEIKRLKQMLKENTYIKREPLMYKLLDTKAPFFLNADMIQCHTKSMLKLRRKKQKSKFTRRKQTR